jgi:hypothetical protein
VADGLKGSATRVVETGFDGVTRNTEGVARTGVTLLDPTA